MPTNYALIQCLAHNVPTSCLDILGSYGGVMTYRNVEGYVYPSNGSAIGAVVIALILLALMAVLYFIGVYVFSLADLH
jgi:hypothetical protein